EPGHSRSARRFRFPRARLSAGDGAEADGGDAVLMGPSALDGILVLDFSHALAGPYCTLLLADFGAVVYKLESPGGGDMGRGWGPPFAGDHSSFFLGLNR